MEEGIFVWGMEDGTNVLVPVLAPRHQGMWPDDRMIKSKSRVCKLHCCIIADGILPEAVTRVVVPGWWHHNAPSCTHSHFLRGRTYLRRTRLGENMLIWSSAVSPR